MTTPGQNEWNDPLLEAAEHVYDGWFSPATKIDDWSRFIDILEDHDFERAIKHLGLPSDDGELTADKLFAPDNTLGYLRQAILQILNGNIYLHDEYRWYVPERDDLPASRLKPIRYSAKTKEYV